MPWATVRDTAGLGLSIVVKLPLLKRKLCSFELLSKKNPDNLSRRIYRSCVSKSCTGNVESYVCPGGVKKTMGLIQAISIAAYDLTRGVNTVGCGVVSRL